MFEECESNGKTYNERKKSCPCFVRTALLNTKYIDMGERCPLYRMN